MDDRQGTFLGVWKTRAMNHARHKEAKGMLDRLANEVRLRHKSSPSSLIRYRDVLGTMLHELAHQDIGQHNAKFYQLLALLEDEFQQIALSKPFAIKGRRLVVGRRPAVNPKAAAAAAAIHRSNRQDTEGKMLGGAKCVTGMTPSQLAGRAAELRAEGCSHCVNIIEGKVVHDEDVVVEKEEVKRNKKEEEEWQIEEQWACAECTLLNPVGASYCDACGSSRGSTTIMADDSPSDLPSKIDRNNGNSNADDDVLVVEPVQGTAEVRRKENVLQWQPLDIEISAESTAEEESIIKKRRRQQQRRVHDDKGERQEELKSGFLWKCHTCTLLNEQMHLACSACGNERTFVQLLSHSNLNSPVVEAGN